jgi:hypothetical protein
VEEIQMTEQPDLIQDALLQAKYREAVKNMRSLINAAWFASVSTPILLALILWRVW